MSAVKKDAPKMRRGTKLTIGFGLVNVDVKYAPLKRSGTGRLAATTCCREHRSPVSSEYRCKEGGELLDAAGKAMLYDAGGQYVEVDTKSLQLTTDKRLQTLAAVDVATIDPLYYESTFVLEPQDGHEQAFDLLAAVLQETGKALVGVTVMSGSTRAVVVRWSALARSLVAHRCVYDEQLAWEDVELVRYGAAQRGELPEAMLAIARTIVGSIESPAFEFEAVTDEYAAALEQAVADAAAGIVREKPEAPAPAPAVDLMAALQASVAAVDETPAAKKTSGKKVAA